MKMTTLVSTLPHNLDLCPPLGLLCSELKYKTRYQRLYWNLSLANSMDLAVYNIYPTLSPLHENHGAIYLQAPPAITPRLLLPKHATVNRMQQYIVLFLKHHHHICIILHVTQCRVLLIHPPRSLTLMWLLMELNLMTILPCLSKKVFYARFFLSFE